MPESIPHLMTTHELKVEADELHRLNGQHLVQMFCDRHTAHEAKLFAQLCAEFSGLTVLTWVEDYQRKLRAVGQ